MNIQKKILNYLYGIGSGINFRQKEIYDEKYD